VFRFLKVAVLVPLGLVLLVLIAGCDPQAASNAPPAKPATKSAANRCKRVPTALVTQIEGFLKPETGATLRGFRAVHSKDGGIPGGTWYVAADLAGPGLDGNDDIVIVPMARLQAGDGHLFGIGGFASEFTNLRSGEKSMYQFSITDDGAHEAESCVKAALKR
jgi:hypothetical protein